MFDAVLTPELESPPPEEASQTEAQPQRRGFGMFSGLASLAQALQGGPDEDEDELEEVDQGSQDGEGAGEDGGEGEGEAPGDEEASAEPALSFWGVASALTATVNAKTAVIKAKTADVLTAVQETDWRAELEAFQQGAKEDAVAVAEGADLVVHKAREAAEHAAEHIHLPAGLESTLDRARGAAEHMHLPGGAAALGAQAGAAGLAAKQRAERGLASLAGLGSKLVLGTHDLFEQISHAVQNELALTEGGDNWPQRSQSGKSLGGAARYSRFDADVAAMQRDSSTYCDEPEEGAEYEAWLAGFDLAARRPDIDALIKDNTFMAELQARIVPLIVEYDAFWTRYFYRLHRLQQKHAQFAQLTQRSLALQQEEEEVGWSSEEEVEEQLLAAAASPTAAGPASTLAAEQASQAAAGEAEQAAAGEAEQALVADASQQADPAAAVAADAQTAAVAAHGRTGSSAGADVSPAATVSSDASQASGEHWQVVSPRKQAGVAAAEQQRQQQQDREHEASTTATAAPAAAAAAQPAAQPSKPSKVAAAATAGGAAAAAAAADEGSRAAKPTAAADDDGELSDWGSEDDAALDTAAAAGTAGGAAGDEDSWGSDWE